MKQSVFDNISTPGTPGEFEETLRGVPEPPTDFNVQKAGTAPDQVKIIIGDRIYVAQRHPTSSYRVYYTPLLGGGASDLSDPKVRLGIVKAGQVVTQVGSQGKGNNLTAFDSQFQGLKGYFSCVGVNLLNVESVPLHICPSPWN